MNKFIYISLVLAIIFIASAEKTFACSCLLVDTPLETQIQKAFEGSTSVFSGEVISIEPKGEYEVSVKIKTSKVWKGERSKEFTVNTANQSAMCGYYFEVGKKYLVYANRSGEVLMTTSCSRTAVFDESGDAKYLNKFLQDPKKLPDGIEKWEGKSSDKILENETIKVRLQKLLGEEDYAFFTEYFETSKPIEKVGNFLFSIGCMIRACTRLESAIAIDLKSKTIHAAIYNEVEETKFFNEKGGKIPEPIIKWANRLSERKENVKTEPKIFLIFQMTVNDAEVYDQYRVAVAPLLERYGGKYLVRSDGISYEDNPTTKLTAVEGGWNPDSLIIIQWDSMEQLQTFIASPEYKKIVGLREKSATTKAVIVKEYLKN